jgi:small subunit ribosomal protein S27e
MKKPLRSKFIQLKCPRCKNNQTTFGKASTWVKCHECNKLLTRPKGGKAKIKASIKKVI